MDFLPGMSGVISILILILVTIGVTVFFRRPGASRGRTSVHGSLESLRAIGELSVFKALTKEIVTTSDHSWGEFGRKYLDWVYSSRKMAMIFEFEIDFRYDLKRSDFQIIGVGTGSYILHMPPCFYEARVKNIEFYDEQRSKLLPFLLPEFLNGFLGSGFSEDDRNKLFASAKTHAEQRAMRLVKDISSDVETSAKRTLQAIGRAFGASTVAVEFQKTESGRMTVEIDAGIKKAA